MIDPPFVSVTGHAIGILAAPFGAAFLAVCALTPLVIGLAHRLGWVARPSKDRWHTKPTALMGGVAIFAGAAASIGVAAALGVAFEGPLLWAGAGAVLMFATGAVDDRRALRPATKLLLQIAAASVAMTGGIGIPDLPLLLSLPLAFVWIIGITNAVNLLDNMDGLASGVSGIAACVLGGLALLNGQVGTAVAAFAVAGAAAGFLVYNFKPARIFMGDCGSLFLGFSVAVLALVVSGSSGGSERVGLLGVFLVPTAIMAVPIFDTTLVTLMRTLAGRAVSEGGRDHTSHRLVLLGFSERTAVLLLYAVSALFGVLTLLLHVVDVRFVVGAFVVLVTGLFVLGRVLTDLKIYPEAEVAAPRGRLARLLHAGDGVIIRTVVRHKRLGAGLLIDALVLMGAHLMAYALRFEDGIPEPLANLLVRTLPVVVLAKLILLHLLGLRTQVWRHTGASDVIRVVAATAAGAAFTLLLYVFVTERGLYSGAVVVFDAVLSFTGLVGARVCVRGLRALAAAQRTEGEPVLIYGAGEAGALVLNELRHNPRYGLRAVGFLDDDPGKRRASVGGLRVFGAEADMADVSLRHGVRRILLAVPSMPEARVTEILARSDAQGLRLSCFSIELVDLQGSAGDGHTMSPTLGTPVSPESASR